LICPSSRLPGAAGGRGRGHQPTPHGSGGCRAEAGQREGGLEELGQSRLIVVCPRQNWPRKHPKTTKGPRHLRRCLLAIKGLLSRSGSDPTNVLPGY